LTRSSELLVALTFTSLFGARNHSESERPYQP
jgi:hypothetical protein